MNALDEGYVLQPAKPIAACPFCGAAVRVQIESTADAAVVSRSRCAHYRDVERIKDTVYVRFEDPRPPEAEKQ